MTKTSRRCPSCGKPRASVPVQVMAFGQEDEAWVEGDFHCFYCNEIATLKNQLVRLNRITEEMYVVIRNELGNMNTIREYEEFLHEQGIV